MSWLKNIQEQMYRDIVGHTTNAAYLKNTERLDVYSSTYFERFVDALTMDFPISLWVLGGTKFDSVVRSYISDWPSQEYDLSMVGKDFSGYIQQHPLNREYPFLADLVIYEWNTNDIQRYATKDAIDLEQFRSIPMEQWIDAYFTFQPGLILQKSDWPLHAIQHAFQEGSSFNLEIVAKEVTYLMFYQQENKSYSRKIDAKEHAVLELLMKGSSLGDVFDSIGDDDMVQSVFGWFQKWQENNLITNVAFESHASE
jgi:hypothetical protein